MKWFKFFLINFLMFIVVFGIANSSMVTLYITSLKNQEVGITLNSWQEDISNYAKENNISPIEPKIDKVWKLIPGYNGLIVDEKATLNAINKQKTKTRNDIPYVWKEVEPKKTIDELGAYPIYRGNPYKPSVSFMINVAWGTEYLEPILKILSQENIKATFFVDGTWLKKNPEMGKRIIEKGHEIGNHAYTHPQMSKLTDARIREEIVKTEKLIFEVTNKSSTYFAPPSGDFDQRVVNISKELHLQTVIWTLDTVDWKKPTPTAIINRIIPKVNNGHLILMHPTQSTVDALPKLIEEIKKKGLYINPVKETLSTKRILKVEPINKF